MKVVFVLPVVLLAFNIISSNASSLDKVEVRRGFQNVKAFANAAIDTKSLRALVKKALDEETKRSKRDICHCRGTMCNCEGPCECDGSNCKCCSTNNSNSKDKDLIISSPRSNSSFDMECKYEMSSWYEIGNIKNCYVKNMNVRKPYTKIESVNGDRDAKFPNVVGFWIDNQTCRYSPQRIAHFFPNLKAFGIHNSGLKKLSMYDLAPFPELLRISFSDNKLEFLDAELLKYNRKIQSITLKDNYLTTIDSSVFDNLPLTRLEVELKCFSHNCASSSCVHEGKNELKNNCINDI